MSQSAQGPKDTCIKGVVAALYGELVPYSTVIPYEMTGQQEGWRKNVAVGTSLRRCSGVDQSKRQKSEDSILLPFCARVCVHAHTPML